MRLEDSETEQLQKAAASAADFLNAYEDLERAGLPYPGSCPIDYGHLRRMSMELTRNLAAWRNYRANKKRELLERARARP